VLYRQAATHISPLASGVFGLWVWFRPQIPGISMHPPSENAMPQPVLWIIEGPICQKYPLPLHLSQQRLSPNFREIFLLHRVCAFLLGKGAELF
jgi:hypothetical protein